MGLAQDIFGMEEKVRAEMGFQEKRRKLKVGKKSLRRGALALYSSVAAVVSSNLASFNSLDTSAAASFSCASSASADTGPATDWFAIAGFLAESWALLDRDEGPEDEN